MPGISTNPNSAYGTTGLGQSVFYDEFGDIQAIPYNVTPPYGEPAIRQANPGEDPNLTLFSAPPDPPFNSAQEDQMLHEWVHGTPWHGIDLGEWVNPTNPGIPNLGPVNDQPFQSAHTNAVPHNASAEQGWGMDPAILYARYPKVQSTNPYWSMGAFRRMGGLAWWVPGIPFGSMTQGEVQAWWASQKRTGTHARLVDVPPNVPFSATVPIAHQAASQPLPAEADGVYP
jgi:hypothetical protein